MSKIKRKPVHLALTLRRRVNILCCDLPCVITLCGEYICQKCGKDRITYDPKNVTCKRCNGS